MNKQVIFAGILLVGVVLVVLIGAYSFGLFKSKESIPQLENTPQSFTNPTEADKLVIKAFMDRADLEPAFVNTDLPLPYFRVGKITKVGNGENMEAVEGWIR